MAQNLPSFINRVKILSRCSDKNKSIRYLCECGSCGRAYIAYKKHLLSGKSSTCPLCSSGMDPLSLRNGTWVVKESSRSSAGVLTFSYFCTSCGTAGTVPATEFKSLPECSCRVPVETEENDEFFNSFKL